MPDLLLDELPTRWAGREIHPDFKPMVWLANAYARGVPEENPLAFAQHAILRFYKQPSDLLASPDLTADAYKHLLEFFLGGEAVATPSDPAETADSSPERAFDYLCDAPYIVAAFQQTYGIDLTSEQIHWWRFKALMGGLPGNCLFCRIIQWRTADLTELSPGERRYYEEMREKFALPPEVKGGAARAVSVADHDAAFLARFRH